jgi:tryptophanyl-tRNA synthetase
LACFNTDYADTDGLKNNSLEMVVDWLTVGIDPDKSVIFRQSDVPEHSELFLLLSMITLWDGFLDALHIKNSLKKYNQKI